MYFINSTTSRLVGFPSFSHNRSSYHHSDLLSRVHHYVDCLESSSVVTCARRRRTFSNWMSRIKGESRLPFNAVVFAVIPCTLIGLLELDSATALNAILGSAILYVFVS